MIADEHPVFGHALEGLPIHVAGKRDEILLNMSRHRHLEKSGVEVAHVRNRRLSLIERASTLMIFRAPSRLGATVFAEGWTHSCKGTYKLSSSHSGILDLRGPTLASLVENDGAATTSNKASSITPSTPGDPQAGNPSFSGTQASLEASWGAPSKAG